MERLIHRGKQEGSITVFLSLVLILILSLIMTVIEGARVNTAKVVAERALSTAMDSILAEFYGPLMEEYHLFGLDAGYGDTTVQEDEITSRLMDYMSYTFSPNRDLSFSQDSLELFDISVGDVKVNEMTGLTDYGGELFVNEAVEYMKYKEIGNGMELLFDKMHLLEAPKRVSVIYEKKLKVEEELVTIDEGILTLMELLDGVSTDKSGLNADGEGNLETVSDFVKKICYGTPTKELVGINNDSIFQALKSRYIDPSGYFTVIEDNFIKMDGLFTQRDALIISQEGTQGLLAEVESTITELEEGLSGIAKKDPKGKEIKAQIKAAVEYKNDLEEQLDEIQGKINAFQSQIDTCTNEINLKKNEISLLINEIKPKLTDAGEAAGKILETADKADPLIKEYEDIFNREKSNLDEETVEGLEEGLRELKRYQPGEDGSYDFQAMIAVFEQDLLILSGVESFLTEGEQALSGKDYIKARECFQKAGTDLAAYKTEGLEIDYSTLVINRDAGLDPLGMVRTLIQDGLMGLIVNPDNISDASLDAEVLPSDIRVEQEGDTALDFTSLFNGLAFGSTNSGLGELFSGFEDMSASDIAIGGLSVAAEHLLFREYLQEHFYGYPVEGEDISARKPSVLSYEKEYLLVGKHTDSENLSSIISRIILLRTVLDFAGILGNKQKWQEAKVIASALVGFTGLPVLVAITQTVLMILLAFAEALVDTAALLLGKEVPLLKKDFTMGFYDLLIINRTFIQGRATALTGEGTGIKLNYGEYLRIFLLFASKEDLSYRSMDLIQENIKIRYEDNFRLQNCLFGFEAEADFHINNKFTSISYLQRYINGVAGLDYPVEAGYSY